MTQLASESELVMISQLKSFLEGKKGVLISPPGEAKEPKMNSLFHDLPDFLILKVFSFLGITQRLLLRRVCKKWYQLLYDFSIWKTINLSEEHFFTFFMKKGNLRKWIRDFGKTIQELDFSNTDWISNVEISQIAHTCFNLRKLSVKACSMVSDVGILEIAHNCPKLEYIDVLLTLVSNEGLEQIVRNCPNIKCVKLGSQGNTHNMLASVCKYCTGITQLSVHDVVPYSNTEPSIDDSIITTMAIKFPDLKRLNLIWCGFITDASLVALANGCEHLRELELRECQQISDQGLKEIIKKCAQVEDLSLERLFGVTDLLLRNGFCDSANFSNLRSLYIFDTKVTDVGIEKIAERCPRLTRFSFGEYSFQPKHIKGSCLTAVARNCKQLKYLDASCEEVNDESLFAIAECLKDLADVSLGDCHRCTAYAVLEVARKCQKLSHVCFKNCDAIENEHFNEIKDSLPYLKFLELPGNLKVTSYGSWLLSSSLPYLVHLENYENDSG